MYNNLCTALDTCIWQYVSPVLYDNGIPGHHDQTLQQTNSEKKPLPGQGDIVNTNQNVTVNFCIQSTSNKQIYLLRPKSNEHAYNKSPKGLYSYNCSLMPWSGKFLVQDTPMSQNRERICTCGFRSGGLELSMYLHGLPFLWMATT